MRGAAAVLMVFAGQVLAHPGHGGAEGHIHAFGLEHAALFAAIAGLLFYAIRK